jgi:hypothetical protein
MSDARVNVPRSRADQKTLPWPIFCECFCINFYFPLVRAAAVGRRNRRVYRLPVSMIFTSGPREIFAINPRFECCLHRRDILSRAERIRAAASSPVRDEDVMLKKRSRAARTACFSSWLYRIRSSRVMTTQPFAPASRSQTTSSVP